MGIVGGTRWTDDAEALRGQGTVGCTWSRCARPCPPVCLVYRDNRVGTKRGKVSWLHTALKRFQSPPEKALSIARYRNMVSVPYFLGHENNYLTVFGVAIEYDQKGQHDNHFHVELDDPDGL